MDKNPFSWRIEDFDAIAKVKRKLPDYRPENGRVTTASGQVIFIIKRELELGRSYKIDGTSHLVVDNTRKESFEFVSGRLAATRMVAIDGSQFFVHVDPTNGVDFPVEARYFVSKITDYVKVRLNTTESFSVEKYRGKYWMQIDKTSLYVSVKDVLSLGLPENSTIERGDATDSLLEPFINGVESRVDLTTKTADLAGFGSKVLGEGEYGSLVRLKDDKVERVVFESLKASHGICQCQECGFVDLFENGLEGDHGFVCSECKKAHTHACGICSAAFYSHSPSNFVTKGSTKPICKTCINRDCYECSHCSDGSRSVFHVLGEKKTCPEVSQKNYSYTPKHMTKVGDRKDYPFHLGVELEVHTPKINSLIRHMTEEFPGMFYYKSDSSIVNGGVECVSIPMGRDVWRARFNADVVGKAPGGVRAEGHGGIHIHVDREAFSTEQIRSIIQLMWNAKNPVEAVAGRSNCSFAQIINPAGWGYFKEDLKNATVGDKYLALNLRHSNTLEFRLFDSTVDNNLFQKNLDFICALWAWSDAGGIEKPSWEDLKKYVTAEKKNFSFLHNFIEGRKL